MKALTPRPPLPLRPSTPSPGEGETCRRHAWRIGVGLALLLAACGTVKSPTEPLDEPRGPAFTFSQVQGRIFTPNCVKSGCHDAATASGEMVLEEGRAYANIVNHPAAGNSSFDRIEPGDPARSYMVKKLRGDPDITGAQMPFDAPGTLTKEQMDGLIGWILAGAPNN